MPEHPGHCQIFQYAVVRASALRGNLSTVDLQESLMYHSKGRVIKKLQGRSRRHSYIFDEISSALSDLRQKFGSHSKILEDTSCFCSGPDYMRKADPSRGLVLRFSQACDRSHTLKLVRRRQPRNRQCARQNLTFLLIESPLAKSHI